MHLRPNNPEGLRSCGPRSYIGITTPRRCLSKRRPLPCPDIWRQCFDCDCQGDSNTGVTRHAQVRRFSTQCHPYCHRLDCKGCVCTRFGTVERRTFPQTGRIDPSTDQGAGRPYWSEKSNSASRCHSTRTLRRISRSPPCPTLRSSGTGTAILCPSFVRDTRGRAAKSCAVLHDTQRRSEHHVSTIQIHLDDMRICRHCAYDRSPSDGIFYRHACAPMPAADRSSAMPAPDPA